MFAGPNGSGKSLLKSYVPQDRIGVFVNADEMEKALLSPKGLDLSSYQVSWVKEELLSRLSLHNFSDKFHPSHLHLIDGFLKLSGEVNSYHASALASVIRETLLEQKVSFSFETVMSHPSKLEFLREAQQRGYRTYLYFIATKNPTINVSRVSYRVNHDHGHDVQIGRAHV